MEEIEVYLREVGSKYDPCWVPCAKGDPGAISFFSPGDDKQRAALRAFVREVAAIDPLSGGGEAKYFVTADFIARANKLARE